MVSQILISFQALRPGDTFHPEGRRLPGTSYSFKAQDPGNEAHSVINNFVTLLCLRDFLLLESGRQWIADDLRVNHM